MAILFKDLVNKIKTPSTPSVPGTQPTVGDTTAGLAGIQSALQQQMGLSSNVDPNLSQDAFAGNLAMALNKRNQQSPASGTTITQTPTYSANDPSSMLSPELLASARTRAIEYKPEIVAGYKDSRGTYVPASVTQEDKFTAEDASYLADLSRQLEKLKKQQAVGMNDPDLNDVERRVAGLLAKQETATPDSAKTAGMSQEDYLSALLAKQIMGGSAMQSAEEKASMLNEAEYLRQRQGATDRGFETRIAEIDREYDQDKQKLINSLAARGLTASEDSYARGEVSRLDRLYADKRRAEESVRDAALLADSDKGKESLLKVRSDAVARADKALANFISLLNAQTKATTATANVADKNARLELLKTKETREGLNDAEKREKDNLQGELYSAQTEKAKADATYTSGAKTENTEAKTGLTKAQTERVTTLLPAELAKMQAQTAKLKRVGSGNGSGPSAGVTAAELEAVYRLNGGKAPISDKSMAQLLNQVRTVNGDVDNLVETQTERLSEISKTKGNSIDEIISKSIQESLKKK